MSALAAGERARLLAIAHDSLAYGLRHGQAPEFDEAGESLALRSPGASFVTLRGADASLRGCIGTLEAIEPLARDVARNAYRAAFEDPRFAPLAAWELAGLALSVSVLGPFEPIAAESLEALAARLRPGIDGLVLRQGPRRATFLPEVWSQLPEPRQFVEALTRKAGITDRRAPVEALRYATTTIGAERESPA